MEVAKPEGEQGLLANENSTEYGSDGKNGDKPETVRVGTESGDRYVRDKHINSVYLVAVVVVDVDVSCYW